MKKFWVAFILMFALLPGVASAQVKIENTTIKRVYYDPEEKGYFLETAGDVNGATWSFGLFYANKENKALTKSLQQSLFNQKVKVTYEDHNNKDYEKWEMLEFVLND
ncbi:hypothetical protein [Aneurinibacillus aneurinilyticus]|nr:hypothetical protein [Aneurinibacillus aneurinilyticus]MCI1695775.1 hypothetical protein [Aneurinibacillus aneurinilyticus]MED0673947.1 hypothetical protein [Aneurinibacillus aneurinilyticus]MED0709570.1 hypothetical protein [Aneurinibacillus aneurinilyticus]MED0723418.1 hypothetical protein [Aneurinibacillus aneurinilyticus]MED0733302.1 hypothetical protein [Aneurinibacillus aneurinilyticus]